MVHSDAPAGCPNCGNPAIQLLGDCQVPTELRDDQRAPNNLDLSRYLHSRLYSCSKCELWFRYPQPSASDLAGFYLALPSDHWDENLPETEASNQARALLKKIFSDKQDIVILDVGSFTGRFLKALPATWKKYAIEPSVEARKRLTENDIEIIGMFLADEKFPAFENRFDAICMFDLLEHLPKPDKAIAAARNMLKDGGVLIISTGNNEHWSMKALKGRHWYFHSLQHCSVMNRTYFSQIANRLCLRITKVSVHPHMKLSFRKRLKQTLATIFVWSRSAGSISRILLGQMARIPGLSYLRHKRSAPFANGLHDHILVVLKVN